MAIITIIPISLWFIAGLLFSKTVIDVILSVRRRKQMQELTDALNTLSTAITNLGNRLTGVLTGAQATQVAAAIRQAAASLDALASNPTA